MEQKIIKFSESRTKEDIFPLILNEISFHYPNASKSKYITFFNKLSGKNFC